MFNIVAQSELPIAARKGKATKDYSQDAMFTALKGLPVDQDNWLSDGKEYTEDAARKAQSKIAAYAKNGAGTFKTSYRGGKVYIKKTHDTYVKQRGDQQAA